MIRKKKMSLLMILAVAAVSCAGGDPSERSARSSSSPALTSVAPSLPPVASPPAPVPAISESDARATVVAFWAAKETAFETKNAAPLKDLESGIILGSDANRISRVAKYGKSPTLFYYPKSVENIRVYPTGQTPPGADRYFLSSQRISVLSDQRTMYVVFRQSRGEGPWRAVHTSLLWAENVNGDPLPASGTSLVTVPGADAACGALGDLLNAKDVPADYWGASGPAAAKSRMWRTRNNRAGDTRVHVVAEKSPDDPGPVWVLPSGTRFAPCAMAETWTFTPPEHTCLHWDGTWGDEQFYGRDVWAGGGQSFEAGNYGLSIPRDGKPVDVLSLQWFGLDLRSDDCPSSYRKES